jgi:hypothetical protein
MIQEVPGNPAGGVALRPAFLDKRHPLRGSPNGVSDRGSKFRDRATVVSVRRVEAKPELSDIGALRVTHVIRHLVPVAATAAGTFAEFCRRRGKNLVVYRPRGL